MEAAAVFLLAAILSFGIGSFMISSTRLWFFISGRQSAVKTAQSVMNRLVNDIKDIKSKTSILKMITYEVQYIPYDSPNSIDYKQVGSNLMRVQGTNNDILATGLISPEGKGLRFTYLNSLEGWTGTSTEVRSIRVLVYLTAGGQSVTLESSARIRAFEVH